MTTRNNHRPFLPMRLPRPTRTSRRVFPGSDSVAEPDTESDSTESDSVAEPDTESDSSGDAYEILDMEKKKMRKSEKYN